MNGSTSITYPFEKEGLEAKLTGSDGNPINYSEYDNGFYSIVDLIEESLRNGYPVLYGVRAERGSSFTNSQHYMALLDISNDGTLVYIANPSRGEDWEGWYDINDALTGIHCFLVVYE